MRHGALIRLAWRSAWHRRHALVPVLVSLALSAFLLLSVERLRNDVRNSFSEAVSGTDLIVGPRTGAVQLLLYAVFRIGQPTHTFRFSSLQQIEQDRRVAWVIPLSLGDTYRGFPVVATSEAYFDRLRYGDQQALAFADGHRFREVFDAVLGAEVAQRLGLRLGHPLVLRHGAGEVVGNDHADKPFTVVGILARTGTPVDRSVHIRLDGMEAIHLDWMAGVPLPGASVPADQVRDHDLTPEFVTAALVGLKSRAAVFGVQRDVASFRGEPLMAILPGVTLDELWDALGSVEDALLLMSALVGVVSLAGLVAVVVATLEQRRRELAVLRSVGAGPGRVIFLLGIEGFLLSAGGAVLGMAAWAAVRSFVGPFLQTRFGISLTGGLPTAPELGLLAGVIVAGTLASLAPAWRAYRLSLADGLSPQGT